MNTIWVGSLIAALLLSFSIFLVGGFTIRGRMKSPVTWRRLALLTIPISLGITVLLLWTGSDAVYAIRMSMLSAFLPLVAEIDRRELIIPNRLLLQMLAYWGLVMGMYMLRLKAFDLTVLTDSLLGGLIGASPLLVRLVSKGGIGMGDIKLFALVGLYVGKEDILRAMFLSLVIALFVMLGRKLRKQLEKKQEISFGPYVAIGTMLMLIMNIPLL